MIRTLLAAATIVVVCAGCGTSAQGSDGGRLRVVAAENFWADLAAQVGGSHVSVTSLISNPSADPHEFEPGTNNGLAVANADVVIVNGAGYDPFMSRLLSAAPSSHRRVVTVADVLHIAGSDPNPHLWYDVQRVPAVVRAIARSFEAADPPHAAAYASGARQTVRSLRPLERAVAGLKRADVGDPVAYTERVPGYLLADAGLRVLTPPGFARSIENGTDPSFGDTAAMRALITGHRIKVLLYNRQAVTPITAQLAALARDSDVRVVAVTETMPTGTHFQAWQLGQVRALAAALS